MQISLFLLLSKKIIHYIIDERKIEKKHLTNINNHDIMHS